MTDVSLVEGGYSKEEYMGRADSREEAIAKARCYFEASELRPAHLDIDIEWREVRSVKIVGNATKAVLGLVMANDCTVSITDDGVMTIGIRKNPKGETIDSFIVAYPGKLYAPENLDSFMVLRSGDQYAAAETELQEITFMSVDFSHTKNMRFAFVNCDKLESVTFNQCVIGEYLDMYNMFSGCRNLRYVKMDFIPNSMNKCEVNVGSLLDMKAHNFKGLSITGLSRNDFINYNSAVVISGNAQDMKSAEAKIVCSDDGLREQIVHDMYANIDWITHIAYCTPVNGKDGPAFNRQQFLKRAYDYDDRAEATRRLRMRKDEEIADIKAAARYGIIQGLCSSNRAGRRSWAHGGKDLFNIMLGIDSIFDALVYQAPRKIDERLCDTVNSLILASYNRLGIADKLGHANKLGGVSKFGLAMGTAKSLSTSYYVGELKDNSNFLIFNWNMCNTYKPEKNNNEMQSSLIIPTVLVNSLYRVRVVWPFMRDSLMEHMKRTFAQGFESKTVLLNALKSYCSFIQAAPSNGLQGIVEYWENKMLMHVFDTVEPEGQGLSILSLYTRLATAVAKVCAHFENAAKTRSLSEEEKEYYDNLVTTMRNVSRLDKDIKNLCKTVEKQLVEVDKVIEEYMAKAYDVSQIQQAVNKRPDTAYEIENEFALFGGQCRHCYGKIINGRCSSCGRKIGR